MVVVHWVFFRRASLVCFALLNFANDVTLEERRRKNWQPEQMTEFEPSKWARERGRDGNGRIKCGLNKIMGDSDDWTISNTYMFDSSCGAYSYKQRTPHFIFSSFFILLLPLLLLPLLPSSYYYNFFLCYFIRSLLAISFIHQFRGNFRLFFFFIFFL